MHAPASAAVKSGHRGIFEPFGRLRAAQVTLALALALAGSCGDSSKPLPIDPSSLPDLAPGTRIGVIYSEPATADVKAMDAAFAGTLSAGIDAYYVGLTWAALETSPGVVNTQLIQGILDSITGVGLVPYLNITCIDTVRLGLPSDLVDPLDPAALAAGVNFDDPALLERFGLLLEAMAPRLSAAGGFLLGIGNEVDVYLGQHPDQATHYLNFLNAIRQRWRGLTPSLALGVSATWRAVQQDPLLFEALSQAVDTVAFNYYPLANDFSVLPPSDLAADLAGLLDAIAPRPLVLQEVGYPSGYSLNPGNGSSPALQAEFMDNLFAAIASEPQIRFVSWYHLGDFPAEVLDTLTDYYGLNDPLFREYLATLGLHSSEPASPKPAFQAFLDGLSAFSR